MNHSIDRFFDKASIYISCTAFACMVLVVVVNVFMRAVLSKSLLFTEELSFMFFIYSVFFGVCVLYRRMGLIAIDIVVDKLPELLKKSVTLFTFLLLFVVNLVLLWFSWELSINSWNRVTPSLGIPYFYNYLSPTLAFLILAYYSIRFFIKEMKGEAIEEVPIEQQS
ncbi:TRAP transporter small permease [Alkalihalobacillus oceani]|uniref:TRAP transporter small permease n=1 Tax=Halalkalibacter oceani TaxID=1653776 RepID=UPI00203F773D|nr:TRAP transporter small permease [Halalkalibacter oceani]MCM3759897.1 TRAP transporter small permease [Halalkalibacter oceani]